MSDCDKCKGRMREICEGTAGLSLAQTNRFRIRHGLAAIAKIADVPHKPQVRRTAAAPLRVGDVVKQSLDWITKLKPAKAKCSCTNLAQEMNTDGPERVRKRRDTYYVPQMLKNKDAISEAMKAERGWRGILALAAGMIPEALMREWLARQIDAGCDQVESHKGQTPVQKSRPQTARRVGTPRQSVSRLTAQPAALNATDAIMRIIPAIRTAHRDKPTLDRTVGSLLAGGFEPPLIFAEPDSPPSGEVVRWPKQLNTIRSFVATAEWLLEHHPDQWYLLCEDDVIVRTGVADYLRQQNIERSQVVSLYISQKQSEAITADGFSKVTGDVWGSLAYLMHADTLRKVLESKIVTTWKDPTRVDHVVSLACQEIGADVLHHRPALCQHIGETSTINAARKLDPRRTTAGISPSRHESPLVTLVTPTGDRPEAFAICERWMAAQRYSGPIEWIVVDDGGTPTDCTQGQKYIRCEPMHDHSLCRNLREALPHINGQFIFVIEDDEYYGPDYLSVMAGRLHHADFVGERGSKYYFPRVRKWMRYPRFHHVALCRLGITAAVIPTLRQAVTNTDHQSVDLRLYKLWTGSRDIWYDGRGDARMGVGIKAMPGRHCGRYAAPPESHSDPDGQKLTEWIGEDAATYLTMFPQTQRGEVCAN